MIKVEALRNFDWNIVIIVFVILIAGLLSVYSASIGYQFENKFFEKQLLWIGLGIICMIFFSRLNFRWVVEYSYIFYILIVLLLIYTHYAGFGGRGSNVNRWINILGITIQPSEFTKIILVCFLTRYFQEEKKIGVNGIHFVPIFILLLPFILIFLQPDLGTSIVLVLLVTIMIFLSGIYWKWIISSFIFFIFSIPFLWVYFLKGYQKQRIAILLDPQKDPLGAGYHIIQSKIAIGSGTFFGKGFLQGKQVQLNFLPARHTDFIFSVLSEEWGFIGAIFIIFVYAYLLFYILRSTKRYQSRTAVILTLGIGTMFSCQILINICMVTGLLPIVGLPLPFMSYGGSSMLTNMAAIGILLNIKKNEAIAT